MRRMVQPEPAVLRWCTRCGVFLNREATVVRMPSDDGVPPFEPYRRVLARAFCVYETVHEEVG